MKIPGRNPFSVAFLAFQGLETRPDAAEAVVPARTPCSPAGAASDARGTDLALKNGPTLPRWSTMARFAASDEVESLETHNLRDRS